MESMDFGWSPHRVHEDFMGTVRTPQKPWGSVKYSKVNASELAIDIGQLDLVPQKCI